MSRDAVLSALRRLPDGVPMPQLVEADENYRVVIDQLRRKGFQITLKRDGGKKAYVLEVDALICSRCAEYLVKPDAEALCGWCKEEREMAA